MANVLSPEKQIRVISDLATGSSIRVIEENTKVHRDTIMRLGYRVGRACARMLDRVMQNLEIAHVEMDEIWGFVGMKSRNVPLTYTGNRLGSIWTYIALDPETRLIPAYLVGRHTPANTRKFIAELGRRIKNRFQLSSDGMVDYASAVEEEFGCEIDYGQIVKKIGGAPEKMSREEMEENWRYSPKDLIGLSKRVICGEPDEKRMSTSHVEAHNLTMRCRIKRMGRLTNAFSKKFEHHEAAIALYVAYYNFCKRHSALRMTPAEAAGVAKTRLGVEDLVELAN